MMNPNELRIGNLVFYQRNLSLKEVEVVTGLMSDTVFLSADHEGVTHPKSIASIEPIPLTEEWQGRLGVVEIRDDGKKIKRYNVVFDANINSGNISFYSWIELRYVHQLQNLYFALTGEELKLNPASSEAQHSQQPESPDVHKNIPQG